ncbi:MAG: hypothetical protein H7249_04720 [Chitinophagaceae bacterium]|nr:hypothetical protein [Oligoflexus sp.]
MRNLILVIGLGSVWACGDPNQKGTLNSGSANVATNGATSGDSTVTKIETTQAGQVEGSSGTSSMGGSGAATDPAGTEMTPASVATAASATPSGPEEGGVTPPNKITGAFLVGTLLPHAEGEPLKVGLVAKKDDVRLSTSPNRYRTNWSLSLADQSLPVTLAKSSDSAYDRVLVFNGTEEDFKAQYGSISLSVSVTEGVDAANQLSSVIVNTLSDLLIAVPSPAATSLPAATETPAAAVTP